MPPLAPILRDRPETIASLPTANHFAMSHPQDGATGRPFIDFETVGDSAEIRALLARLLAAFIADTDTQSSGQSVNEVCREAGDLVHDHLHR